MRGLPGPPLLPVTKRPLPSRLISGFRCSDAQLILAFVGIAGMCSSVLYSEAALADFDNAIAIHPNELDAYDNRSRIYRGRGKLDLAMADLSTSIAINPNLPNPYRERGVILFRFDFSGAADDFGRAISLA